MTLSLAVVTLVAFAIGRITAKRDHAPRVEYVSLSPAVAGSATCADRRRAVRARRVLRHSLINRR